MVKSFLVYCRDVLLMVRQTYQNTASIKKLEAEVDRLSRLVEGLAYQAESSKEVARLERENLTLQLKYALLQFERRLPPA